MGFTAGRVTFVRFRVLGESPLPFAPEQLEAVGSHAIGRHTVEGADGVTFGWSGGDHVLDETFSFEKNVLGDALHLGVRIDSQPIPGDLLRAYSRIELDARAAGNPSGRPTKAQRQEAKEAALQRAQAEAADGRFRRRKLVPALWDGLTQTLYAGTTSAAALDRITSLFRDTFGRLLEPVTAGSLARERVGEAAIDSTPPMTLHAGDAPATIAWAEAEPARRDDLGNEFLVWLWHTLQGGDGTIALPDGSEAAVMLAKTLTLDCPLGQTGSDTLRDEGPARLPEAFRALQSGKLPRKVGLILARQGQQFDLTLQAETWAVSGLALPKPEDAAAEDARLARVESLRQAVDTLDLLYEAFLRRRVSPDWMADLGSIRRWLQAA